MGITGTTADLPTMQDRRTFKGWGMDASGLGQVDLERLPRARVSPEVRWMTSGSNANEFGIEQGQRLTPAIIEDLKRKGLNQAQIGELFGISRQAVSKMKRSYGRFSMTPRERVMEQFPWKVPSALQQCGLDHRMRDHAEYVATGGKGMSHDKLDRLSKFYKRLDDEEVVVEFDPNLPPSDDAVCGGWRLVPRTNSDGDLMIRVNEYTTITSEGRMLWRIPRRRPLSAPPS
jgi:predicted XRE-type DNA-binding protein